MVKLIGARVMVSGVYCRWCGFVIKGGLAGRILATSDYVHRDCGEEMIYFGEATAL